jgi:hypothetical protein
VKGNLSIDAHDSYGSSGGFARSDAEVGGGCTPCVGVTLLASCKHLSVLS